MYHKSTLSFDQVPQFSTRDKAYQSADPRLRPFMAHDVDLDSFGKAIELKGKSPVNREALVGELNNQYNLLPTTAATQSNIDSLDESKTFTIVTAHQPSLLTGPLYYIYKISSAINLCHQLGNHYPDYKFVPVFITGGEDHDFEEIATLHLFNRDYTWNTEQKGATGRMSLDGLEEVINEVKSTFGSSQYGKDLEGIIDEAYSNSQTYGAFMIAITNALFGKYGLVVLNMDSAVLKKQLLPYIIKDIQEETSVKSVTEDQKALEAAGFSAQAHAREVNIFWHGSDRHRVIKDGSTYSIDTDTYDQDELIELLRTSPENISPNVILRPVYQEVVLPNLAYIGGGGELAYWLERKRLFQEWEIPFPMLIRRDSVLIIDRKSHKTLSEAGISINHLFQREEQILGAYAKNQTDVAIDLSNYKKSATELFSEIENLATRVDPTLAKAVGAESAKSQKSIDIIEQKMLRAAKQKNEVALNRISKIKKRFFPGNDSLQERYDNFVPFYLKYGQAWIDELVGQLDPMDKGLKVLVEE